MSASDAVDMLLKRQLLHDESFHRDVAALSHQRRLTHLALHFAKYAGRMAEGPDVSQLRRTLADTSLVALSAATVLGLSGAEIVPQRLAEYQGLRPMGDALAASLGLNATRLAEQLLPLLAQQAGRMSKACEALDHMEAIDYKLIMKDAITEVFHVCVAATALLGQDLDVTVETRHREIEGRRID